MNLIVIAIVLECLGLILVFLEFYLPGAVLGTLGAFSMVAGMVSFAIGATSAWEVIIFIVIAFVLLGIVIKFALYRIKHGKRGIYLKENQEGYFAMDLAKNVIGKQALVISDLKPSGHIILEQKKYQALSNSGYIESGSHVEVINVQGAHLIVRLISQSGGKT